jgi:hypothetical protein
MLNASGVNTSLPATNWESKKPRSQADTEGLAFLGSTMEMASHVPAHCTLSQHCTASLYSQYCRQERAEQGPCLL